MKRHEIWRRVQHDYEQARARAHEGYEPLVVVHVAGQRPIEVGFVETRRPEDEIWVRIEAAATGAKDDDEMIPPEVRWVHVPETAILGVEVRYRKTEPEPEKRIPIGFRYEERDE
jgi:hypothetical protein